MEGPVEELERTWDLCRRIDLPPDRAGLKRNLLEPTASLLGAETAVFRVFPVDIQRPVMIVGLGIGDCVHDAYLNRYIKLDPIRRLLTQRLTGPLIADHEGGRRETRSDRRAATQHQQEFRQYLREFLVPNDFYHHAGFCFQDESRSYTFLLDYHRPRNLSSFGPLEIARAKIIALLLHARAAQFSSVVNKDGARHRGGVGNRLDPAAARRRLGAESPATAPFDGQLSTREIEVAEAVARGLTNKEVGDSLGISVRTVENHMRSIFSKLQISTRTRLAAKLHRTGPATPPPCGNRTQ
jgi:DNA-binding CsgD family transcriptional regulator